MKQAILGILRDIFTSSGYDVTESYRHDLVAEKGGHRAYIRFGNQPDYTEIKNFADQITDGTGVYVMTDIMEDDLYQYAKEMGLIVWDREEIAIQIGRAVIADIEGTTGSLELIKPVVKQTVKSEGSLYGMFRKSNPGEGFDQTEPSWEETQMTPQAYSPNIINLHATPVNISKEQAISIAKPHLSGIRDATLKFVPFWRYNYSVSAERRYKSKIIDISGNGQGCMNALNGNNEVLTINEIFDQVEVPDENYEVKTNITTKDEIRQSLLEMIVREHSRDIRFDNMIGEAIISEHKLFKPAMEDIDLNMEMIYIPIWEVKGPRNSIEINGYSSEILSNPVDDDVEFI